MNQRQRSCQFQPQAVSTPRLMVSRIHNIHRFSHSDMMHVVFATSRLLELYILNRQRFMSASNLEMVSYTTRRVANAFAEATHWQIIEMYCNTAIQQNNIWSIAFEAHRMTILTDVCWSHGECRILHNQSGTRFEHKFIMLNPILFNQQGTTSQSCIISTALNLPQSICNSLIPFWQTISISFP